MRLYKVAALVILFCVMFPFSVFASPFYEYGQPLINYRMDEPLSSSAYWYIYQGSEYLEIDKECMYDSKASLRFDVKSAMANYDSSASKYLLNFSTTSFKNDYDISADQLYVEFYVKGPQKTSVQDGFIRFIAYINSDEGTNYWNSFTVDDPDEQGWMRVWSVIPNDKIQDFNTINLSCLCSPTDEADEFYIDAFSLVLIPCKINVQPLNEIKGKVVDLNKLVVYGYDVSGDWKRLSNGAMEFSVLSGNVELNDNIVVFDDDEVEATISLSYFGISKKFVISRKTENQVFLSSLTDNEDQTVSVEITSTYSESVNGNFLWMTKHEDAPYQVITQPDISVLPNTKQTVTSPKIRIPSVLENTEIILFYFDDAGNFKKAVLTK